jgi:ribosome-associated translation inhibitor RaiA
MPLHFRALGIDASEAMREHTRDRLGFRLRKFAGEVTRARVRLHGSQERGAASYTCTVKVMLSGLPPVVVTHREPDPWAALDLTFDRVDRAVRSTLRRHRAAARPRSAARRPRAAR